MVLLYLRGLLKPDYAQGYRSIAREEMLLRAVEMETSANMQMQELLVQAAFVPLFDPKKAPTMIHQMSDSARRIMELAALNVHVKAVSKAQGSVESMTKLYTALVKQGIIVEDKADAI